MLQKICTWLAHSENKVAPAISLKEMFGDDFDFLAENYLASLDDFAQRIVLDETSYEQTCIEENAVSFIEPDTLEPRKFKKSEARLWKFNERKFIGEISKLLKLDSTAIRLGNFTDGYCLGTLQLDHKYAIFVCFNELNFQISALGYLKDGVRPFLIRFSNAPISEVLKNFILEYCGVECHIADLFSFSQEGLQGGNIKSLLGFKGTRQSQQFNLESLKNAMRRKNIADLIITIIERDKINFKIKEHPFSLTLEHTKISDFYNSRLKTAKECWYTLYNFAKSRNEHRLLYSPRLKNRLKELRSFFRKIKDVEFFELYRETDYNIRKDGKRITQDFDSKPRSKGKIETFVKPLFEIRVIDNEYEFNQSDRY